MSSRKPAVVGRARKSRCPAAEAPPRVVSVGAFNAIYNSGPGRGCTHSVRMRRGPGALTGPGTPRR
ncbi:hypothetical protein SAM23877_5807 [Streptomyces ambofaciens ATCC 23877]|uniref:Uncharacterized protein n=1 Tax=Streptomyces ambofaciens (strain ATCC 23877 / 3486 / DSM 40053 / JCM 4204 / NBRC 12836 / NRRL B-2516) TaxID=278992 RepID=A0A0K2B168_STRA7|nr:hypothetical protein SAM23877_5807 [Streptomyces ambofaciens ATCC 23877]